MPDKLFLRDEEADHGGVDDMTKLTYLNEPGVLDNLKRRYALNEIYVSFRVFVCLWIRKFVIIVSILCLLKRMDYL